MQRKCCQSSGCVRDREKLVRFLVHSSKPGYKSSQVEFCSYHAKVAEATQHPDSIQVEDLVNAS